jgi:ADP-L-glycero-D-manno-heptose 6-epimerase
MFDFNGYETIVTGGAGFIGSALVWKLNERGINNVLIVDRLDTSDKWKNLAPLRFSDYMDADEFVTRITNQNFNFSKTRVLLHLGACASTTERDARYMMQNNYEYTKTLAHWAVANNVRFIYASSAATYGDGSVGMQDGVEELEGYRPLNVYGYSKHLFDLYAHRTGLLNKIVGLKYFNVFGPNENHKGDMRSLVNKAFTQIRETNSLKLFKSYHPDFQDGEFGRDFVYVKDVAEMTLHFVENQAGGLFNIGSGQMHTWRNLAETIFSALDLPPKIEFIEMPEELRGRYQYHTQADLTSLRQSGYEKLVTPLKEAVFDYLQNYLIPDKHLGD